MEYRFTLPVPPSTNMAYGTSKGGIRYKMPEYKKWVNNSLLLLKPIKSPFVNDRLEVIYTFHFETDRRRDIANYEKLLTDTLAIKGIMQDDSQIDRMILNRGKDKSGMVEGIIRVIG